MTLLILFTACLIGAFMLYKKNKHVREFVNTTATSGKELLGKLHRNKPAPTEQVAEPAS